MFQSRSSNSSLFSRSRSLAVAAPRFATVCRRTALGISAALLGVAGLSALPGVAHAGPPEWLAKVAVDPQNPMRVTLAYENRYGGLLFSEDGGEHFDMRCMWSMDTGDIKTKWEGGSTNPVFAVTGEGVVLVPVSTGLAEGDMTGCGFALKSGNPGFGADALAPHPTDPNVHYAYMGPSYDTLGTDADAHSCTRRGLVRRNADGTYTPLGEDNTRQPDLGNTTCNGKLFVRSIAAAHTSGGAVRIYETAARYTTVPPLPLLIRYTENDGVSFTENVIDQSLAASGVTPSIVLVNPANPDQLIIRFHPSDAPDTLYTSNDAGRTLSPLLAGSVTNVSNALISSDGRVWLADRGDTTEADPPAGLWVAPSFGATFTRVTTDPIYCLGHDGTSLVGCTIYGYGPLDEATGKVTERFNIKQTRAYVSCAGEEIASACDPQMCNPAGGEGWCGALHHAEAPICDRYNSISPCCGWPARDYDQRANAMDPTLDGTCRVVAIPSDAGVADSGVSLGDGGVAVGDSGVVVSDAGAGGASGDGGVTKKKDDGCSVAPAGSSSGSGVPWSALLFSAVVAGSRLRRRRR